MANVLQVMTAPDLAFLDELAESLDGVLSRIAYDGMANDRRYIHGAQKRLARLYGARVDTFMGSPLLEESGCGLSDAVHNILSAYGGLQDILNSPDIEQEAMDLLHEHLLLPDDPEEAAECAALL